MDYSYPLLQKVFNHYYKEGADVSKAKLYSCMHLLAPQIEMYKYFIKFGFSPSNIIALGKIYSSNIEAIEELRSLGVSVVQPDFDGRAFDTTHAENCKKIALEIGDTEQNIVLDDGGFLIHEARSKPVRFAVEQTSSGFRKLENDCPQFPIFNVARSKTKLTQESPLIARQIFERVVDYAKENGLESPKVVIVGLGPIGEATLQIFKSNSFDTTGFDKETTKTELLSALLKNKPDIVIGATGSPLFSSDDVKELEGNHIYHLVSVSSSDREYPVASYRSAEGVHEVVRYENLRFVNNGFPISFKGSKNELTPVEIEKTIALLMGSVFHGVCNKSQESGFVEVPEELQDLINS